MTLTGQCLCGQYSYSVDAEPVMTMACHCKNCQRQSGSAFSTNIGVPRSAITSKGSLKTYIDTADSGNKLERQFCGDCGSPIYSLVPSLPDIAIIKAGTLDDTSRVVPQAHIWCKSSQKWVDDGQDAPRFSESPS